jgi:hypothetical protein
VDARRATEDIVMVNYLRYSKKPGGLDTPEPHESRAVTRRSECESGFSLPRQ